MNRFPLITVVITSYNYAHWIQHAIESVLSQSYPSMELLILDNASTDSTSEVVASYLTDPRVRWIVHPHNIGMVENHNYGIRIARGEYIVFVSADDLLLPGYLEAAYQYLQCHPQIDVVYTSSIAINDRGEVGQHIEADGQIQAHYCGIRNEFSCLLSQNMYMSFASMLIRRDLFDRFGLLEPGLKAMDYEIVIRWAVNGIRFAYLPEAMVVSRLHENELSSHKNSIANGDWLLNYLFILERYIVDEYASQLYGYTESIRSTMQQCYKQALNAGFSASRTIEERIHKLSEKLVAFTRRSTAEDTPLVSMLIFEDVSLSAHLDAKGFDREQGIDVWLLRNPPKSSENMSSSYLSFSGSGHELRFIRSYTQHEAFMAGAMFARGRHLLLTTSHSSMSRVKQLVQNGFQRIVDDSYYKAHGCMLLDSVAPSPTMLISREYIDRHRYRAEALTMLLGDRSPG